MGSYNLNTIGATEFEHMSQALLKEVIGSGTITFGAGAARTLLADTIQKAYEVRLVGGRIEERALQASTALVGYSLWPGLAQVLEVTRVVTDKWSGRLRSDVAYAITSVGPERASAAQLLELWCRHWEIENRVHWVRDVTFEEDACRVRKGHGPEVLAALRNTALGLLRAGGETNIARGLRHFANRPSRVLPALGLPPLDNK